jgi:ankyrin repeat protein
LATSTSSPSVTKPLPSDRTDPHVLAKDLFDAIRECDAARVQRLLEQGADANGSDETGETALMRAALNADANLMRVLLAAGADVHVRGQDGTPPLVRAAHDVEKVRMLLEHGAIVDDFAMVAAARVPGSRATLDLLLAHGGNGRAAMRGYTALMAAAGNGDREAVHCLLDHGADVQARMPNGFTALNAAAIAGDAQVVAWLLERGADPNVVCELADTGGNVQTPALVAAALGHADCLKRLLAAGADVNFQGGPMEETALLGAATTGSTATVRLLLGKANVSAPDARGQTPLDWSLRRGDTDIVKLLRQAGAKESEHTQKRPQKPLAPLAGQRTTLLPSPPQSSTSSPTQDSWRGRGVGGEGVESSPEKDTPSPPIPLPLSTGGEGRIRQAITAALPLLQRSGRELTQKRNCVTCHQHSLVAMAVGLARKHGIEVDETIAAEEQAHVLAHFGGKLRMLLLGTGIDSTLSAYTLMGLAAEKAPANRTTDALVHYLAMRQHPDGHWQTENYRPPEDASDFLFTALAVRGLQTYAAKGRSLEMADRVARGRNWLQMTQPADTTDRAFQLLGLGWAQATPEAIDKASVALLREQREDGGWAQLPTLASDAYATGLVLYALHEGGRMTTDHPAYRRGVEFLLRTQQADGSWFVASRSFPVIEYSSSGFPHGRSQFISAAATCWATMALTLTVPPSDPHGHAGNDLSFRANR